MSKMRVVAGLVALMTLPAAAQEMKDAMGKAQSGKGTGMDGSATYTIVLKSTWTKASHPFEYPAANLVTGPHFSGMIGAAHNASYSIFAEGSLPTKGLEALSEMGKPTPLDEEIKAATRAGHATSLFGTGPLRDLGDSLVATVTVDPGHPLVSIVAMIAPSPDWFAGARSVSLREGGAWVTSRTIQLNAYDSGGDDGATYKADDLDTNPKKPTSLGVSKHFAPNGVPVPVATVTITKKTM